MLVRLLPQSDDALIAHELARMGHQTPEALLGEHDRRLVWKCIGVPCVTATVFLDDISHTTEQANGKLAATTLGPLLDGLLDARRGRSGQRCPPGQSPRTP